MMMEPREKDPHQPLGQQVTELIFLLLLSDRARYKEPQWDRQQCNQK